MSKIETFTLHDEHLSPPIRVEAFLLTQPPGSALITTVVTEDTQRHAVVAVREDSAGMQKYGAKVRMQPSLIAEPFSNVIVVDVLVRLDNRYDATFETCLNYYAADGKQLFDLLSKQEEFIVGFVVDKPEFSRLISCSMGKELQLAFAAVAERAEVMAPWSMSDFNRAKAHFQQKYSPQALSLKLLGKGPSSVTVTKASGWQEKRDRNTKGRKS